ncbi:MAG: hypothetical protein SGARI_006527 [Bacillariaceae sp.]
MGIEPEIDTESAQYYDQDADGDYDDGDGDAIKEDLNETGDTTLEDRAAHAELDGYCMAARSNSYHDPNIDEPSEGSDSAAEYRF